MFENGIGHFIVEITDEDMEVTEKWLVKVSIVEEATCFRVSDGHNGYRPYVSRSLVYELIQKFAPSEEMVLGFEVSKLPILMLSDPNMEDLDWYGRLEIPGLSLEDKYAIIGDSNNYEKEKELDTNTKLINVKMDEELFRRVVDYMHKEHVTMSDVVADAVKLYLEVKTDEL